jgi:hypothetical protein
VVLDESGARRLSISGPVDILRLDAGNMLVFQAGNDATGKLTGVPVESMRQVPLGQVVYTPGTQYAGAGPFVVGIVNGQLVVYRIG